jgi:hypothetical protein
MTKTTIGTEQQIADHQRAVDLYRPVLRALLGVNAAVGAMASRALGVKPPYGAYPQTMSAHDLERHVTLLESEVARLSTEVEVVLDLQLMTARQPYTARVPNPPETLHLVKLAETPGTSLKQYEVVPVYCGRAGLQWSGAKLFGNELWRVCKRCLRLATTDEELRALGDIRARCQIGRGGMSYDRAQYERHYRLNGVVY